MNIYGPYHGALTGQGLITELEAALPGEFESIEWYERDEDGDYTRYYADVVTADGEETMLKLTVEYDGTCTAYIFNPDVDDYGLFDTWTSTTLGFN